MTAPTVSAATNELDLTEALIRRIAAAIDEASPRDLSPLLRQMLDLLKSRERLIREAAAEAADAEATEAATIAREARNTAAAEELFAEWIASQSKS